MLFTLMWCNLYSYFSDQCDLKVQNSNNKLYIQPIEWSISWCYKLIIKVLFLSMGKPTLFDKYTPYMCLNVVIRYYINWICFMVNLDFLRYPPIFFFFKSAGAQKPIELEQNFKNQNDPWKNEIWRPLVWYLYLL